jgi:hypothetical protein
MPQRKGTSPTYEENKTHIYKWRERHPEQNKNNKLRAYYKGKIDNKDWANIKYIFFDILICDVA